MESEHRVNDSVDQCCGCGLCAASCPVSAIEMREDDSGYVYPAIDVDKCVGCDRCREVCIFTKGHEYDLPLKTYAGVREDSEKLCDSSSGGIFAAVAEAIIADGGLACGARIMPDHSVRHVIVGDVSELKPLLGSKYVQSDMYSSFGEVGSYLKEDRRVLFCGTPCQVDAIKRYTSDSSNLLTMEVVCHGVPNQAMFSSFLETIGGGDVEEFVFRDKGQGWSFNHKAVMSDGHVVRINHRLSSYMTLYMNGCIYRESCFSCPYAQSARNADITIGDFWGVVRKRSDLADALHVDDGVSCVLANSEKGLRALEQAPVSLYEVDYADIVEGNGPLKSPSRKGRDFDIVQSIWRSARTWSPVHQFWRKHYYRVQYSFWAALPNCLRHRIRVALGVR